VTSPPTVILSDHAKPPPPFASVPSGFVHRCGMRTVAGSSVALPMVGSSRTGGFVDIGDRRDLDTPVYF
jgi:hypothetical protein